MQFDIRSIVRKLSGSAALTHMLPYEIRLGARRG